jgi:hypothetical protein
MLMNDYTVCASLRIGDIEFKEQNIDEGLTIIERCPATTPAALAEKCSGARGQGPKYLKDMYPFIPLVYNNLIYGNTFCLNCHTGQWLPDGLDFIKPKIACHSSSRYNGDTLLSIIFRFCNVSFSKQSTNIRNAFADNKCDRNDYCKGHNNENLRALCNKYYLPYPIKTDSGPQWVKNSFCAQCLGYNESTLNMTVECPDERESSEGPALKLSGDLSGLFVLPSEDSVCSSLEYLDTEAGRCKTCPRNQLIQNEVCVRDYKLYVVLNATISLENATDATYVTNKTVADYILGHQIPSIKSATVSSVDLGTCRPERSALRIKMTQCEVKVHVILAMRRNVPVWSYPDKLDDFMRYFVPENSIGSNIVIEGYLFVNTNEFKVSDTSDVITINSTESEHRYHFSSSAVLFKLWYRENETDMLVSICTEESPSVSEKVRGILSMVLLALSLVGTAFVVVTHARFRVLRNLPGKNLMSLSSCMFFAILLFLLKPHASGVPLLCSIIAVISHFAWLTVFAWMNIIAIDTWKTFRPSSIRIDQGATRKAYGIRCLYAFGTAAIIVCISAILSFSVPDVEFEYGGSTCWINNMTQQVATFAAPVGLICLLNIVLFVWTVASIMKVRTMTEKVKSSKKETLMFLPYVKLSVILGLSWILGFAVMTGDEVVAYLFTVLNSSQGILLCLVFVSNPRILRLWGYKKTTGSSYASSASTISTVHLEDKK